VNRKNVEINFTKSLSIVAPARKKNSDRVQEGSFELPVANDSCEKVLLIIFDESLKNAQHNNNETFSSRISHSILT
jgi:hypothetical protein